MSLETSLKTTTLPVWNGTNVTDRQSGFGLSPLDNITVSQILLPVLCALFITIVVVVIACCLIQKKAKPPNQWRERSCHTIETSHDNSDHGIYDVIDEGNIASYNPERYLRRHDRLSSNCLFVSQHGARIPKTGNVFITSSSRLPCKVDPKFDIMSAKLSRCGGQTDIERLQCNLSNDKHVLRSQDVRGPSQEVRVSCAESNNEDEDGIYETLDRHWTFRNQSSESRTSQNFDKRTSKSSVDLSTRYGSHRDNRCPLISNPNFEELSNYSSSQEISALDIAPPPPNKVPQNSESQEMNGKTLCQIRMFQMTNNQDAPSLIESAYFYVHIQQTQAGATTNPESFPQVLQNSSLRIVPECLSESNVAKEKKSDILLKPLKNVDLLAHEHLLGAHTTTPTPKRQNSFPRMVTKIYDKPYTSKRTPILLVKKSESFRGASSEINAMKEKYCQERRRSESCHIDTKKPSTSSSARELNNIKPPCITSSTRDLSSSRQPCTSASARELSTLGNSVEVKRILTKLGPLPPLPVQSGATNHKELPRLRDQGTTTDRYSTRSKSLEGTISQAHTRSSSCYSVAKPPPPQNGSCFSLNSFGHLKSHVSSNNQIPTHVSLSPRSVQKTSIYDSLCSHSDKQSRSSNKAANLRRVKFRSRPEDLSADLGHEADCSAAETSEEEPEAHHYFLLETCVEQGSASDDG